MTTIKVFGGNDGWVDKEVSDEIAKLVNTFTETYEWLYEEQANGRYVIGYNEALARGDRLIRLRHPLVTEFMRARENPLTSDREVAAFAFAASELGMV